MKLLREDIREEYSQDCVSHINKILQISKDADLIILRNPYLLGKSIEIKIPSGKKICMYGATLEGSAYFNNIDNNNIGEVFFEECYINKLNHIKHSCNIINVAAVQPSNPTSFLESDSISKYELQKLLNKIPKYICTDKKLDNWVTGISKNPYVLDIKFSIAGFTVKIEYRAGSFESCEYSGKPFEPLNNINTLSQYKKNDDNKDNNFLIVKDTLVAKHDKNDGNILLYGNDTNVENDDNDISIAGDATQALN